MIYREFFLLIGAYIKTTERSEFVFDIIVPLLLSLGLYYVNTYIHPIEKGSNFLTTALTFISIILGFTIASITIILTSNAKNMLDAQKTPSGKQFFSELNLYQMLLIPFFYIALIGFLELIFGAISYTFKIADICSIYIINMFLVLHILFVAIRNLTNLFFIVFKK